MPEARAHVASESAGRRPEAAARTAPTQRPSLTTPAGVLALQRQAGNRATSAVLARCVGACTCGGNCGGPEELLEEELLH